MATEPRTISKADALAEAYKRGLLPPDKKAAYEEAQRRGLIGAAQPSQPAPQAAPRAPMIPQSGMGAMGSKAPADVAAYAATVPKAQPQVYRPDGTVVRQSLSSGSGVTYTPTIPAGVDPMAARLKAEGLEKGADGVWRVPDGGTYTAIPSANAKPKPGTDPLDPLRERLVASGAEVPDRVEPYSVLRESQDAIVQKWADYLYARRISETQLQNETAPVSAEGEFVKTRPFNIAGADVEISGDVDKLWQQAREAAERSGWSAPPRASQLDAAGTIFNDLTLGFSDEFGGAIGAAGSYVSNLPQGFDAAAKAAGDTYTRYRDDANFTFNLARQDRPAEVIGGNVGTMLVPAIGSTKVGNFLQGASTGNRVVDASRRVGAQALTGAGLGALYGVGTNHPGNPADLETTTLFGAVAGGGLATLAPVVSATFKRLDGLLDGKSKAFRSLPEPQQREIVESLAAQGLDADAIVNKIRSSGTKAAGPQQPVAPVQPPPASQAGPQAPPTAAAQPQPSVSPVAQPTAPGLVQQPAPTAAPIMGRQPGANGWPSGTQTWAQNGPNPPPPPGGVPPAVVAGATPPAQPAQAVASLGEAEVWFNSLPEKVRKSILRTFEASGVENKADQFAIIADLNSLPPGRNSQNYFLISQKWGEQYPSLRENLSNMGGDFSATNPRAPDQKLFGIFGKGKPDRAQGIMDTEGRKQVVSERGFLERSAETNFGAPSADVAQQLKDELSGLSKRYNWLLDPTRKRKFQDPDTIAALQKAESELKAYLSQPWIINSMPDAVKNRLMVDASEEIRRLGWSAEDLRQMAGPNRQMLAPLFEATGPLPWSPEMWTAIAEQYPRFAAHVLQSSYAKAARDLGKSLNAADNVGTIGQLNRMRGMGDNGEAIPGGLLDRLEKTMPNADFSFTGKGSYADTRRNWGDIKGAQEAFDITRRFKAAAQSGENVAEIVNEMDGLSPRAKDAALSEITSFVQDSMGNKVRNVRPGQVGQAVDSIPNLTALGNDNFLSALRKVFRERGDALANDIELARSSTDSMMMINRRIGPNTRIKDENIKTAKNVYEDPAGLDSNIVDSTVKVAGAAGFGAAATGQMGAAATLAGLAALQAAWNKVKQARRLSNTERSLLADFMFRSRQAGQNGEALLDASVAAPPPRSPNLPSRAGYAANVLTGAAAGGAVGAVSGNGDPNAVILGILGGAGAGGLRAKARSNKANSSIIKPRPATGNALNPPAPRTLPGQTSQSPGAVLGGIITGGAAYAAAPEEYRDGAALAGAILGAVGGNKLSKMGGSKPKTVGAYSGVTVRTPEFDGPRELRRLLGEPSKYRPWQDNPKFKELALKAGESVGSVSVKDIVPGQPQIRWNYKDIPQRYGNSDADLPWLVRENGKYYIRDGTHRIAAQVDGGAQEIRARIIDLDSVDPPKPKTVKPPPGGGGKPPPVGAKAAGDPSDPFGDKAWQASKKAPPPKPSSEPIDTSTWTPEDFRAAQVQLNRLMQERKTAPAADWMELDTEIADLRRALELDGSASKPPPQSMGIGGKSQLPMDEASRMQRAREMGFDVDTPLYHGTASDVQAFDPAKRGGVTNARSAKLGTWLTGSPKTAKGYADLASEKAVADLIKKSEAAERAGQWDKANAYIVQAEKLEASGGAGGQNTMPLYVRGKMKTVDMDGAKYDPDDHDLAGMVREAKAEGFDGVRFENFSDEAGWGNYEPTTHVVVFDPANIRGKFAKFDPSQEGSSKLLAGFAGELGVGGTAGLATAIAGPRDSNGDGTIDDKERAAHQLSVLSNAAIAGGAARLARNVLGKGGKKPPPGGNKLSGPKPPASSGFGGGRGASKPPRKPKPVEMRRQAPRSNKPFADPRLTPSQRLTAEMLLNGYSYDEIADEMMVSNSVVKQHAFHAQKRLGNDVKLPRPGMGKRSPGTTKREAAFELFDKGLDNATIAERVGLSLGNVQSYRTYWRAERRTPVANVNGASYNPPAMPPRPFESDYPQKDWPNGPPVDAQGRLYRDIDGKPLNQNALVIGRRKAPGDGTGSEADRPLRDKDTTIQTLRSTGTDFQRTPRDDMPSKVDGYWSPSTDINERFTGRGIAAVADDLDRKVAGLDDRELMVIAHELAHSIDFKVKPSRSLDDFDNRKWGINHLDPSYKPETQAKLQDQLERIYRDLNNAPGAQTQIKSPLDRGYSTTEEARELWAEAIRAYMYDPNYIKTVAPDVAFLIRHHVNKNPSLRKTIQFNAAPLAAAGGGAALAAAILGQNAEPAEY